MIKASRKPGDAGDKLIYTEDRSIPPKDDFDILLSLQRTPNERVAEPTEQICDIVKPESFRCEDITLCRCV
jgi:hypothetical protein